MDKISGFLTRIGILFVSLGILSFGLMTVGLNLKVLVWLDYWGSNIGVIIRFVIIVLGVIFLILAKKRKAHGT